MQVGQLVSPLLKAPTYFCIAYYSDFFYFLEMKKLELRILLFYKEKEEVKIALEFDKRYLTMRANSSA